MADGTVYDPLFFDALAEGVFKGSQNADDVRAGLLTAYSTHEWSNPDLVLDKLKEYADDARHLYRDQSLYSDIGDRAPVSFQDVIEAYTVEKENPDGSKKKEIDIDGDIDLFNKWEKHNLDVIRNQKIPEILVNQVGYEDSVKKFASEKRQATQKEAYNQLSTGGKFLYNIAEQFANIGLSAARPAAPIVNAAVNIFTDDFDLNRFTNEVIDPEWAKSWTYQIQGGIAQGATTALVAGYTGLTGLAAYQGVGATAEVVNRATETKRQTGDTGEAATAGAIEAASQVVQFAGERFGFGKAGEVLTKGLKGPALKTIGQQMFAEAFTEGAGQILSNVAENYQTGKPRLDVDIAAAGKAAAIGAISAGVVGGAAAVSAPVTKQSVPGRDPSTVRADELEQFGTPITPVNKQKVGPIASRVTENPETELEPQVEVSDDGTIQVTSKPTEPVLTPLYEFEDGSIDSRTDDGRIVRVRPDGVTEEAFDDNIYVDINTAANIVSQVSSGNAQLTFDADENPVLKSTDGSDTYTKITASNTPVEGMYRIGISRPVSPNKQETVTHIHPIPAKIRKVSVDRSIGAAGTVEVEEKLSTFGKRLFETFITNPQALAPSLQSLAKEGLYYTALSHDDVDTELRQYGSFLGLANWYMSTPVTSLSPVEARASTLLYNQFNELQRAAKSSGDVETYEQLRQVSRPLFQHMAKKGAVWGASGVFLQGKKDLERINNSDLVYEQTLESALEEEAEAEDIPVQILKQPDLIDSQIIAEKQAIKNLETEQDRPDAEAQEAYEEEIAAIEIEGQESADTINTTVDEDITNLEQSVVKAERKIQKRKAKDIEKIEEQIANDSVLLLELTADAQEVKDLTQEEIDKLDTKRTEQFIQAEKEAESELKQLVSKTREEAKKAKQLQKKTVEQRYKEAKAKADELHNKVRENVTKLKVKRSSQDEAGQIKIDNKIAAEEQRIVKARTREFELKKALDDIEATPEIEAETEEILQELESGITVAQIPVGKKRKISIATKKSGLDLAKLFKKSQGGAFTALSGLSGTVNALAGTLSAGTKIKESANAQLQALQKRINDNKNLVQRAKQLPAGSKSEQKQIADAKRRLQQLRERAPATAESVLPANKKKKLDLYKTRVKEIKERRANRPSAPEINMREKRIAELERKRIRAQEATKRAKQRAIKAAQVEAQNEEAIDRLESVVETLPESGTKRTQERQLALRKAASKGTRLSVKMLMDGMFTNNLIGNFVNLAPALMNLAVIVPAKTAGLAIRDAQNFITKYSVGKDTRSTLLPFIAELVNRQNWTKGISLARANLAGERVGIPFDDAELAVKTGLTFRGNNNADLLNDLQALRETDWLKFTQKLTYETISQNDTLQQKMGKVGRNAYLALAKLSGQTAGRIVRLIPALEALYAVPLTSAFQAAAAAYYHNKSLNDADIKNNMLDADGNVVPTTAPNLQEFIYNSKENRAKAEKSAADYAAKLKEVGVELSKFEQRVLEEEIFQSLPSRMYHGKDAIKQVGQIGLNTPAQGVTGILVQTINNMVRSIQSTTQGSYLAPVGYGVRYLTPFANSIGQMAGMAIELSPVGLGVGLETNEAFNRTPFERDLAVATSIVGTSVAGALLLALRAELEKPEEERFFDIIGNTYSSNSDKTAAFKNSGGLTNSIRVGNVYIPYPETALSLIFGALGGYADRVRDGKAADDGMVAALTYASFDGLAALSRVSMVKGLTDIYDIIQNGARDRQSAGFALQRTLLNMAKPLVIPGLGALRSVAKYTDNPVDGWKDIRSAFVEGLPYIQSAAGKPALNVFGEPLKPMDGVTAMHRIFSTRAQDLDIRWLVDRGYSIPTIADIKLDTREKALAKAQGKTLAELEYPAKRAILRDAGPQMRSIVRGFRSSYGYAAKSEYVQEQLRKRINKVLSVSTVRYLTGQIEEE